ncbi:LPS assembly protein LptD [Rodentibacter caecimuris]|uniref:LPS-assembly protein LptD n=1 Tax=Rodentibacter caecimuris TaxID=1796644 RepID=A0AAJ3K350_9PAST|nr:LPS assembly protein LptD [Rodentibacter heylii]AOF53178.1 Outer membrane protein Imp / Organic solvent tolerance protein precursor [Pasteurellaceae bacterium NI1060]MCQ9123800.1 LPS assembly protein LptD [Rodentibacter heylii]OOF70254.1 LPS assembly protein LptD [Rodentibacter heylii]OOF76114.1 LPS assembly protein LptD [Rodentibacter heylii]OOF77634.1 LPS assembly protein LptD [Rodentibacter heylii]
MNKKYTLISLSILTALYSQTALADLRSQCLLGVPTFSGEVVSGNPNDLPVYIEADDAEINQPTSAIYKGNADLKQGNRHLIADSVEVKQTGEGKALQRFAYVRGGFDYKDDQINMLGQNADFNLESKDGNVTEADYQLVGRQGRGKAQEIELRNNTRVMKNATFTSCLPNDNAWAVDASEIRQYIKEEYAEMWHARFKVLGVPVFYTPYLQLPIGDRRRSGLLIPSAGSSSRDGYWYSQPIYWNIAPNYDATIIPKYMSHRGWQLNGEFRYLTPVGEGKVAGEYLARDRYDEYYGENRKRHLFYWNHSSSFLQNWRLNIDYTRVSDKRYFTDFTSDYGSSTDGYANQYARIAYYQPNYNFAISARQFQIFDEVDIGPYRAMPQIDFNYYKNDLANGWLDFKLFSQAVRFDNDSSLMPTAWRFHLEPSLATAMSNKYGSLNIETKLYATHYQQKKGKGAGAEEVESRVNRVIPQIKVDLQTVLARDTTFLKDYTQTFEPRVQYLYRPYRNQSNIGSSRTNDYLGYGYDSSLVQQDYYSLFRDRRYSGLDRIASANQVTLGGTTRFYDRHSTERFNFSAGQTYHLTDSRIDSNPANSTQRSSSSWALESNWKLNDNWNWHGSYQYDTQLKKTSLVNTSIEYNPERNNLIQLNYRYASQAYIDQNLGRSANAYNQDIKQLGLVAAWEVTDNWAVVGKYYQDLALKKPVEQYLGVQYNSCCWAVGVGARRHVTSRQNQGQDEVLYDNSIGVTFELRGLGTNDHQSGIQDMLKKGKLPYIKAYSL